MAEQEETLAFLSRQAERVISTHISHVFLGGGTAYKIKRAVRFPYLDYTSLAARKIFCERELALNRRTAPGLYRRVRTLTRAADGGLEWDGAGAPVEYVLEMSRFPDEALLGAAAARGPVDRGVLRDLADTIAGFHAKAETATGAGLEKVIEGNAERLSAACPPLDAAVVAELNAASRAAHARLAPLLARRAAAGRVRRCHGDLHLDNIVLLEGRPVLFDCIEFSDEFACIDVLYDLAFLLMDLLRREDAGGAALVANRYMDVSGDEDGLAALPLFISARAAIRAHVCAAQGKAAVAGAYLALAARALRPASPRLVAVGGFSGSGKSTLAARLAPRFSPPPGARVLRSDVLRKRLAGVTPETRLPARAYTPAGSARVYAELLRLGEAGLRAGFTIILDAAFLRAAERGPAIALAARLGLPFDGFWLDAPDEVLAARLAARRRDASDAGVEVLRAQRDFAEPPATWPPGEAALELFPGAADGAPPHLSG